MVIYSYPLTSESWPFYWLQVGVGKGEHLMKGEIS